MLNINHGLWSSLPSSYRHLSCKHISKAGGFIQLLLNKQPKHKKRKEKRGQKGRGQASRKEEEKLCHQSLLKRILNYTSWLNMLVSIKIWFWELSGDFAFTDISPLWSLQVFVFTHALLVQAGGEFIMICCLGLCLYLMWPASDHFEFYFPFYESLSNNLHLISLSVLLENSVLIDAISLHVLSLLLPVFTKANEPVH